jgi:hypothetical protein
MGSCQWLTIILLICFVVWVVKYSNKSYNQVGGEFPSFSYLYQDISDGNPSSWSNRDNPFIYRDRFIDAKSAQYVYQGSPNPLMHQMKPMKPADTNMFFFANYEAKPECCPSPFSTSTGCVCIGAKPITTPQNEPVTDLPILANP